MEASSGRDGQPSCYSLHPHINNHLDVWKTGAVIYVDKFVRILIVDRQVLFFCEKVSNI